MSSAVSGLPIAPALLASVVAAQAIGGASSNAAPIFVGALIDGAGFDEVSVGLIESAELCFLAAATVALSNWVATRSRWRLAAVGACVAIAGHAASSFTSEFGALLVSRAIAGIGEGAVFAAGNAAVASAREPDRLYGAAAVIGGLGSVGLLVLLPYATVPFGPAGGYWSLAALTLGLLPLLLFLPDAPAQVQTQTSSAPNRKLGMIGLLGVFTYAVGQGAVWAFTERIGVQAGLEGHEVGENLGVAMLFGMLGAASASALGTRVGRSIPLGAGVLVQASAVAMLVTAPDPAQYQLALMGWAFSFFFCLPFLMGVMASLDPAGRWAAAAAGLEIGANGLGPVVGGAVLGFSGYGALGGLAVLTGFVALGLMLYVIRAAGRTEP